MSEDILVGDGSADLKGDAQKRAVLSPGGLLCAGYENGKREESRARFVLTAGSPLGQVASET